MSIGVPEVLLLGAVLILPIGFMTNWIAGFRAMQLGQPLVPQDPRDNVPWGLVDLGVILIVVAALAGGGVAVVTSAYDIEDASSFETMAPTDLAIVFLSFGAATLLATALSFLWMWLRYQRLDGFSTRLLGSDIELGIRWFMMLIIPVVGLQLLLTRWFPTKHPLIEMLRQSRDVSFLPVAAFAALIAAPLFEEAFFRLFLQGWLEKLQLTMLRIKTGLGSKADTDAVVVGGFSSALLVQNGGETDSMPPTDQRPLMWIPILVSSALFSLAHFRNGPDWVPLFFLALGLGYLYQRTGRIQACIVVHVLVNLLSTIQLWSLIRQA